MGREELVEAPLELFDRIIAALGQFGENRRKILRVISALEVAEVQIARRVVLKNSKRPIGGHGRGRVRLKRSSHPAGGSLPPASRMARPFEPDTPTAMTSDGSLRILENNSTGNLNFRYLERTDYAKNFPSILAELTKGCDYPVEKFQRRFDELFPPHSDTYKIIVIEDLMAGKIVGCGSILLEKKFIRDTGIVSMNIYDVG